MSLRTFFLPLLLLTILSITACRKSKYNPNSDNGLPPATQTGANIFACRINGKLFIAHNDLTHLRASLTNDSIAITGWPKIRGYFSILGIQIKGNIQQGRVYHLAVDNTSAIITYATDSTCMGISSDIFQNNAVAGGIKLTKFDTLEKIVSGTFNCLIPANDCDTLKITDGRFDIQY